jgi:hypothetical protein
MNDEIGSPARGLQLVLSSMDKVPFMPSFIDGRDSILKQLDSEAGWLDAERYEAEKAGIWRAFTKFGMGVNAQSPTSLSGPKLSGVKACFKESSSQ